MDGGGGYAAGGGPSKTGGSGTGDTGSARFRNSAAKQHPLKSDCAKGAIDVPFTRSSVGKSLPGPVGSQKLSKDSRVRPKDTCTDDSVPGSPAAANTQAAQGPQSKEGLEVNAFLAGLGLDRYVSIFMDNGFDCMEVVELMEESHMREMGMATGHALKLRKKLEELNPPPAPAPAPAPAEAPVVAPAAEMV